MKNKVAIFWFRRDLRLDDNTGLQQALSSGFKVLPIFIFDTYILDALEDKYDRRVDYFHQALSGIDTVLQKHGSALHTYYGKPLEVFKGLTRDYEIQSVYCNRDYEPYAKERDGKIKSYLQSESIQFYDYKDQVVFEKDDVIKNDSQPYTVYTPFSKKWKKKLTSKDLDAKTPDYKHFLPVKQSNILKLKDLGFQKTDIAFVRPIIDKNIVRDYDKFRDYPALNHTSHLGIALRFGTISIRQCVAFALKHNETWLNELIWREFFMQILYHFPKVVNSCFKPKYEKIKWLNNEDEFKRWCDGKTGYPIVDAGMHQLNETGFMHNRVRMIVASFLCKHLLIDWRWGEAYFAQKLLDYELSSNNGNWQWAAGCGCDAAPYFRIFNPTAQTQKFDKDLDYIRKWNPDFESKKVRPIVQHEAARSRALEVYSRAVKQ